MRALRAVTDLNGRTIRLGGGTWNLFPEEAAETVIYPSNNDCGPARSPFLLEGLRDVIIDGEGARLLVRGTPQAGRGSVGVIYPPVVPFIARDCANVTIRNLSIDWATPGTIQGTCVAKPEAGVFEVELETTQRVWCWNGQMYVEGEGWTWAVRRLLAVDAHNGAILPDTGDNLGAGYDVTCQYAMPREGVVRIAGPTAAKPVVGCKILFWCTQHDIGGRRAPAIFVEKSTGVHIENVTLNYCWAMGIIAQNSGDLSFAHLVVEPSGSRLFSLAADGAHLVNCRGKVSFEQCRFQNQFDDAINSHGLYHQVVRVLDSHSVRIRCAHPQHQGVDTFQIGDRIRIAHAPYLQELAQLTLARVTRINGEMQDLQFDALLPADTRPGDYVENLSGYATTTIRNCVFRWNRARGILINGAQPILVENNTFESPGAAILIESSAHWAEAGPTGEVILRDNTFQRCCHTPSWGKAVIQAVPEFLDNAPADLPPFHGKIHLSGNRFEDCYAPETRLASFAEIIES